MGQGDVFVAFLDILGFKSLINENSNDELEELYDKIFSDKIFNLFKENKVNFISISDSYVLYTQNNTYTSLLQIISAVGVLFTISMANGLPLRGAITVGRIFTRKNKFNKINQFNVFGKPLVRAYELESEQEWAGCRIDPQCFLSLGDKMEYSINRLIDFKFIIKYRVPLKDNVYSEEYVLNWTNFHVTSLGGTNRLNIDLKFSMHRKKINSFAVKLKISNTVDFLIFINAIEAE
ncbi:MAG TPA: hypothetical protein VGE40_09960, partial [Bacilli bacterium]